MKKWAWLSICFVGMLGVCVAMAQMDTRTVFLPFINTVHDIGEWVVIDTVNTPTARHENGFVRVGNAFYLVGGRGEKPIESYSPASNRWAETGIKTDDIHHFQGVTIGDKIYIIGAWTGGFPFEDQVEKVLIYDVSDNRLRESTTIPSERQRGAAGSVYHNGKIYVVGGAIDGHGSHATTVAWFDEYDPTTGAWIVLPAAPHARDHFSVSVIDNKLYSVGGRISGSDDSQFPQNVVREVDVYDFDTGVWTTLPEEVIDGRGGSMTAVVNGRLLLTGGEGFGRAWGETEWLLNDNGKWQQLAMMQFPRHATQLVNVDDCLYTVGGSGAQGGSPELTVMERFSLSGVSCTR